MTFTTPRPKRSETALRSVFQVIGPLLLLVGFFLALLPYVSLRGEADRFRQPTSLDGFETTLFGVAPTRAIQEATYASGIHLFDFPGFLLHLSWFVLPFLGSVIVARKQRERMLEFQLWVLAASYLSVVVFAIFPVRPPWMEEGVHRVLEERAFIEYTSVDTNQFAAFPSLHATLPLVIALFFWIRVEGGRPWAIGTASLGFLISLAVVYLGEHWVVDVVAGWLLAASVAWLFVSQRCRRVALALGGRPLAAIIKWNHLLMAAPPKHLPEDLREVSADRKAA